MAISPSGSIHYYWRMPDGVTIRNDAGTKLGPGIDIRGVGGMVIAPPSRRADGVYRWLNELPVANAPHWLLAAVVERQPPVVRRKSTEGGTDRGFIELLLTTIDPDASYTTWFAIGCALFSALGDEIGEEVWDQWSSNGRKYKPREIARKWRGTIEHRNHSLLR